jgi:hypothetical protein
LPFRGFSLVSLFHTRIVAVCVSSGHRVASPPGLRTPQGEMIPELPALDTFQIGCSPGSAIAGYAEMLRAARGQKWPANETLVPLVLLAAMPRALAQPEPRSQKVGMRAGFDEPSGWSADARCIKTDRALFYALAS